MFGDSSINSVGGDAGKLLPQTDEQTDGQPNTDGRTDTHNPLFFFEKRGDNKQLKNKPIFNFSTT